MTPVEKLTANEEIEDFPTGLGTSTIFVILTAAAAAASVVVVMFFSLEEREVGLLADRGREETAASAAS